LITAMAKQLRACRARDGSTLQQLATRCGVAASTIQKIERQQMVPTVSPLLEIARALLSVSPAGRLARVLGVPNSTAALE
jgi:transcriptional regulator with XRE-family HTH domain